MSAPPAEGHRMPELGAAVAHPVALRPAQTGDLGFAAATHAALLSHGFFGRLGPGFLRRYYATFLGSPYGHATIATIADRPVGVLVGTLDNRAHYEWVLRHQGWRLAVAGLLALLRRPGELVLFLRTRVARYVRAVTRTLVRGGAAPARRPAGHATPARVAVLTHVAVLSTAQGRGAGRVLVEAFCEDARQAGADEARLVTLTGDQGAGTFYQRSGWRHLDDHPGPDGLVFSTYARGLR